MDFPPILVLAIIWLLIGLPLSKLSKAAKKQTAKNQQAGAPRPSKPIKSVQKPAAPKPQPAAAPVSEYEPVPRTVLQPTISFTEHDDSVYQGSMNAQTGEGYDPCHDEQMEPLTLAETAVPAAETEVPGLQLNWNGSEVVRGIVMSEILTRRA